LIVLEKPEQFHREPRCRHKVVGVVLSNIGSFKCVLKLPVSLGIGLINSPGNQCRKRLQCGIVLRLQGKYSPGEELLSIYFVTKTLG